MQITIRAIGNSKGIVLPKPVLAQTGLQDEAAVELSVEDGAIVLRRASRPAREGWAEAAKAVAAAGEDTLVLGEFSNAGDADLEW